MLRELSITNFGLIDQLALEFDDQLNILTGETGAGKSIVIDALRIALGERINASQVRDSSQSCVIEALFEVHSKDLKKLECLQEFLEEDDQLIIQRTFTSEGRHRIKINGLNVTVSQLKEVGNYLIDFHGPHDHQMLLSPDSHLGMLDRLVSYKSELKDYQKQFEDFAQLKKQCDELDDMTQSRERELDLLTHQVKELEQVPLDDDQYSELEQEQAKVNNAQTLNESVGQLMQLLEGDENSLSELIRQAFGPMRELNQTDESTGVLETSLTQMQSISEQIISDVREYADSLSFEPGHAAEVNRRFDIYEDIKRKYGPTIKDAKSFYDEAKQKHDLLANFEDNQAELQKQLKSKEKSAVAAAKKITELRQKAAKNLKKTIEKELSELGIANVQFEVRVEPTDLHAAGQDQVTFYISPNVGMDLKPLAEIVSSGEAARVMLALKKALIKVDPIPVLIFDEIDAQIGGRLGTITGQKLREISDHRQVLLITHLPQIASFADAHFKVTKSVKSGKSTTQVNQLDKEARVQELAKMMSGEKESKISVEHAHDLLAKAGQ